MKTIYDFTTLPDNFTHEAGSKAYALAEMTKAGFPVPPSFVLTVSFFASWMESLQTRAEWAKLLKTENNELRQASAAMKTACSNLAFTPAQEQELQDMLLQQGLDDGSIFAVRSSSPEEDLAGASFAGGYETSLGITTKSLHEAIVHSFASSFDERIFLYKREHGIEMMQPRIAVLIQPQIAADSAGVGFSVNPLNNCYDEAAINANFGLGESVVSGIVEPDLFVVDKLNNTILHTEIGTKDTVITLAANGGIETEKRQPDSEACLTPEQVQRLTELMSKVEDHYQHPVDIEWAIAEDRLYLLQVRPITTYLQLPEEMITAPGTPKRLYADNTLIEQGVQEPLSVLGTDFLRCVLNAMTGPMGSTADSVEDMAFTCGGRYYMNLSKSLQTAGPMGGLAPGSAGDETILGIIENIDTTQYIHDKPSPLNMLKAVSGPLMLLPKLLPVFKSMRNPQRTLDEYYRGLPEELRQIEEIGVQKSLSMQELVSQLTGKLDYFFYGFGLALVFPPQIAQMRIRKLFEEEMDQVSADILSLGTALPGNKTSEMGAEMAKLAESDVLKNYDTSEAFMQDMESGKIDPAFIMEFNDFVKEFGSRCPREIDVATPRMNEHPALLFDQLKQISAIHHNNPDGANIFEEAKQKREAAFDTLYQLALAKGKRQAASFKKQYHIWVTLGGYRETPKHNIIRMVDLFRKRALEVGQAFVEAGRLDDPNQIFDLTIEDMDHGINDPALDLRELGAKRSAPIHKIKRSHYLARVLDSRGKIFFPARKAAREGELAGVPISSGVVQGRVKVLHTSDEKELLPDEILVTRATDPGWTPLFINAGGVILEVGGALQHGAVVAREYGLPCVSGIANATDLLEDGQLVEVDGSNGIVRVLDGELPPASQQAGASEEDPELASRKAKAQAKQKMMQTVLRIVPVIAATLLLPILVGGGFMVVHLLMGNSFAESMAKLMLLWESVEPFMMGITNIIGATVILGAIWRNRKKIAAFITKGKK